MHEVVREAISLALERKDISAELMEGAIGALMDGLCSEVEIAAFLTALRVKGESVDELVGAARAMQRRAARIPTTRSDLLDTCGTGGDQLHTFNISTATALVAAAAGVPVAKHGNRSVSSSSGSADVLEALGVRVELTPEQVAACLERVGLGFCFAPLLHQAMKHAAPVRRQLGFRTIFNLLGPLTNPARAQYQLLGVNSFANAEKIALALARLGRKRALVVCCSDSLDEVGLWGETLVFQIREDKVTQQRWSARTFGLPECRPEQLRVGSPQQSAEVIRGVLSGRPGPARDIVLANTAAALIAAGRYDQPAQALAAAAEAIDSGRAAELLDRLVQVTHELSD